MAKEEHFDFENEVRRIAGLLWPTAGAGGAVMQLNRELLAVTEDLARVTAEWESASLQL